MWSWIEFKLKGDSRVFLSETQWFEFKSTIGNCLSFAKQILTVTLEFKLNSTLDIWADICHISKSNKLELNVYLDLGERYAEQAGFEHHIEDVCALKYAWKSPQKYLLSFAFPKGRIRILLRNFTSQLHNNYTDSSIIKCFFNFQACNK